MPLEASSDRVRVVKSGLVIATYPIHGLERTILLDWLERRFPGCPFQLRIRDDSYLFHIPRQLTKNEREVEIASLRNTQDTGPIRTRDSPGTQSKVGAAVVPDKSQKTPKPGPSKVLPHDRVLPHNRVLPPNIVLPQDEEPPILRHDYSQTAFVPGMGYGELTFETSEGQMGSQGATDDLYKADISQGFTCIVYEVNASVFEFFGNIGAAQEHSTVKLALKRLSKETNLKQFAKERNALSKVAEGRHRNTVDVLNAFRYADETGHLYYNFTFPLAACSLQELFFAGYNRSEDSGDSTVYGHQQRQITNNLIDTAMTSLWSEFEGLASALRYLHVQCNIVHADIKPSNILVYWTDSHPRLVTKLADFGESIDLEGTYEWRQTSREYQSALCYNAPEIRRFISQRANARNLDPTESPVSEHTAERFKSGDVWKLGAVFMELLTFLVQGPNGVRDFRDYITTTYDRFTKDEAADARFDNGKKVKPQVLTWLGQLSLQSHQALELRPLLEIMLANHETRPKAATVVSQLRSTSLCLYSDKLRYVSVTRSEFTQPPSICDRGKEKLEKLIREKIDWWPLSSGNRTCPPGHFRISWTWAGTSLCVDVPENLATQYRNRCTPISSIPQPLLRPQPPGATSTRYSNSNGLNQFGSNAVPLQYLNDTWSSSQQQAELRSMPQVSRREWITPRPWLPPPTKKIDWCVDRAWTQPRNTQLCRIQQVTSDPHLDNIGNDHALCKRLLQDYYRIRTWKGRWLSWKTCLGVDFVQHYKIYSEQDEVKVLKRGCLPGTNNVDYEYLLTPPEEVHRMIAEAQIIRGMHHPSEAAKSETTTLSMIPKKIVIGTETPDLNGWGIHAQSHFSLWKILAWVASMAIIGLTFVILWLYFVDNTDLQNAFIPYTFMATLILIALGVPQFLGVEGV